MRITAIKAYPLAMPIPPGVHKTSWGEYTSVGLVVVELQISGGIVGYGEALSRKNPKSSALMIEELYAPLLIGEEPFPIARHWQTMFRQTSGRAGGAAIEAIAAIDIALWDVMGKVLDQPVHRLLGGMGRTTVAAYGSAVSWQAGTSAEAQIDECLHNGFRSIKLKLGNPAAEAITWARRVREHVGPDIGLSADANWAYDVADAVKVAAVLHDLEFVWFEEPLLPEDVAAYSRLAAKTPLRLAAGESEYVAAAARDLISSGAIGVFQPDCARAGGITETRRMIELAAAYGVVYAPHVGGGGAVSAAANLQLAAAMPSFVSYECMIFPSTLRTDLAIMPVAEASGLINGEVPVPRTPGIGIEINWTVLERLRIH